MLRCAYRPVSRSGTARCFKPNVAVYQRSAWAYRNFHKSGQSCAKSSVPIVAVEDLSKVIQSANTQHGELALAKGENEAVNEMLLSKLSEHGIQLPIHGTSFVESFSYLAMTLPHSVFEFCHYSIPWIVSIPLATIIIRGVMYAATQAISRTASRRVQTTHAFNLAYRHATSVMQTRTESPSSTMRKVYLTGWRNTILKRYSVHPFRVTLLNLANLPVWFATIEALRSMVGTNYGLFGLICRSLGLSATKGDVLLPEWIESSMHDEGALWFHDLTLPDPYGILSILLGLAIARSIFKSTASLRHPSYIYEGGPFRRVWVYGAPMIGFVIIPMTLQFPAALLIYWLTSSISAPLMKSFSDAAFPGPLSARVKPLTTGLDSRIPPKWLVISQQARSNSHSSSPFGGRSRGPMR